MLELILAGGWLMLPIVLCSLGVALIGLERHWALKAERVAPKNTLGQVWRWLKEGQLDGNKLKQLRDQSPLGQILAAGLANARQGRELMKESIEESAAQVVHELERYLNLLGTIAAIAPLLGLLGTVIGMIKVFSELMLHGSGNATLLAGGISEALVTTAAGLTVAIPALALYRHYTRRVDTIVLEMEQEAVKLVEALHGERRVEWREAAKA